MLLHFIFSILAIDKINLKLKNNWFNNDTNVYIVLSMPLSDMSKGTVVTHVLNMLPNSDAIKVDGLLNTNKNGRHTASGMMILEYAKNTTLPKLLGMRGID